MLVGFKYRQIIPSLLNNLSAIQLHTPAFLKNAIIFLLCSSFPKFEELNSEKKLSFLKNQDITSDDFSNVYLFVDPPFISLRN